jgi:hypothetical protein
LTATLAVYLNRDYSGDLYWLLAAGKYATHHGISTHDPFLTLAHGKTWYDQQWLTGILFHLTNELGGLALVSLLYGLLLGLALLPLVIGCRHKRLKEVALAWLLSLPMLVALLDPRAEGFSLLAFSILLILTDVSRRRSRVWLIPVLFVCWANLHAAFLVGFLFLALVALGAELDRRRGLAGRTFSFKFLAFGLALPAVLVTPLGFGVIGYFRALGALKSLPRLTYEWDPSWTHPYTLAYPLLVLGFAGWLYKRAPAPRPLEPLLVAFGFAIFATTATRQMVWLGPLCFYLLRSLGRPGRIAVSRRLSLPVTGLALTALVAWLVFWAPPPNEPKLMSGVVAYLAQHPPLGRVALAAGSGSLLLYENPRIPLTIDGRFENYSDAELAGVYDIVGHRGRYRALIRKWGIRAIGTRDRRAVQAYEREGWRLVYDSPSGFLLER